VWVDIGEVSVLIDGHQLLLHLFLVERSVLSYLRPVDRYVLRRVLADEEAAA